MRREGTRAIHFGKLDKKDFLIPLFALFYFYTICGAAFAWPLVSSQVFFHSNAFAWVGVGLCYAALVLFLYSLISFGKSFRVGIDVEQPDQLVTTGIFAFSRNPMYVAFISVFVGQFLVFPNWIPLLYLVAAIWVIHRQVQREEHFMKEHYGHEYVEYCGRVRRYV